MSLSHSQCDLFDPIKTNGLHPHLAINNDMSVLDLLFMWKKIPAIKLSFLLNRAMELVGHRSTATLFYFALGGAFDYNYGLAAEEILHVAAQYGNYFYTFWYDITHE